MPINKFGHYLKEGDHPTSGRNSEGILKINSYIINCENRRLANLGRAIKKRDALTKEQFEEEHIHALSKIKTNTKEINKLREKIEKLSQRITTPSPPSSNVVSVTGTSSTFKRITPSPIDGGKKKSSSP